MIIRPINEIISVVRIALILTGVAVSFGGCAGDGDFERRVSERVVWQMDNYPESRLRDLYKNFFQDRFGPGHMIADSASAGAYLRRELLMVKGPSQVNLTEVTGWRGDYVRIDLWVIKEGLVSYQAFLEAFMESAQGVRLPQDEKSAEVGAEETAEVGVEGQVVKQAEDPEEGWEKEWKKEWKRIEKIAKNHYPDMPDFQKDSRFLDSLLIAGKYVVHHSDAYSKSYDPHYRLFRRSVYENRLKSIPKN